MEKRKDKERFRGFFFLKFDGEFFFVVDQSTAKIDEYHHRGESLRKAKVVLLLDDF